LLAVYDVAGLDENFDDLDVRKITEIGYDDFYDVR